MAPEFSDEYVANLMKKESEESSTKYPLLGLGAYLPTRPTNAAPKPNTRFLNNLLRDANQHNAALLAKEARDARERQRRLREKEQGRLSPPPTLVRDERRSKPEERLSRKRDHSEDRQESRRRSRSPKKRRKSDKKHGAGTEEDSSKSKSSRRKEREISRSPERKPSKKHRDESKTRKKHRRRSRSPSEPAKEHKKRHEHSSRQRARSPAASVSSDDSAARKKSRKAEKKSKKKSKLKNREPMPHDSDSLEEFIGPPPPAPIQKRGRGAFTASSTAMDSHFQADYDPRADVQPDVDTLDDWDQALERIRDRQKLQQQHAERLRAAGFTEEQLKTWAKGGEKDESDVRWTRKGESREWDRGKVVDADGEPMPEPEWGRLKGT